MKKKLVMLLSTSLLAGMLLGGCGKEPGEMSSDGTSETSVESESTDAEQETEKEPEAESDLGEPAHLTVEVFDRGDMTADYGTPTDNEWTKWIQERVMEELNIEVEFVSIPRSEETTKISALIAAGQEPDIFFTYSMDFFNSWADDGALADLAPYLDSDAPDLKEFLDSVLIYGQKDGKQYGINARRIGLGTFSGFIRKDWLDKLNIEVQERNGVVSMTPTELKDALTKMKEAGYCNYPFGVTKKVATMEYIIGAFTNPEEFDNEERRAIFYQDGARCTADGAKDGYRFLNECFNEGLINPDFALYEDEDLGEWVASSQCGFWSTTFWSYQPKDSYIPALYAADPDAEIMAIEICHEDGTPNEFFTYPPNGAYAMVSAECEDVSAAVKYLNWLVTEEAHIGVLHGFEDEHWVYDENGVIVAKDAEYNSKTRVRVGDLDLLLLNDPCVLESEEALRVFVGMDYDPTCIDLYLSAKKISEAHGSVPTFLVRSPESKNEWTAELSENGENVRIKSVMAPAGQFDAVFDENMEKYMQEGFGEVTEEVKEIYAETYK